MEEQTDIRRQILQILKREKGKTIAELAERLGVTYEAARQQIVQLERDGWIAGKIRRTAQRSAGRPISQYTLTMSGDHLFPKSYDRLAIKLVETMAAQFGIEGVKQVLAAVTEEQVRTWEPLLAGKGLEERLDLLRNLYFEGDPFMEIERGSNGIRLIERNCPYLNVATAHPALCSTSVSLLTRLLGVKVLREERFQSGDGCCAFRLLTDQPIDPAMITFELEPPKAA